jgi:hypothetical protein
MHWPHARVPTLVPCAEQLQPTEAMQLFETYDRGLLVSHTAHRVYTPAERYSFIGHWLPTVVLEGGNVEHVARLHTTLLENNNGMRCTKT